VSENEELTNDQLEELSRLLVELQRTLEEGARSSAESSKPVELDQPIGRLSRMDALQQQHMAKENRRALDVRRKLVGAALVRLERGEYGLCQVCEEPIGYRRLAARPESPLCMPCQRTRERR
jgi:DnaK suppressor protein